MSASQKKALVDYNKATCYLMNTPYKISKPSPKFKSIGFSGPLNTSMLNSQQSSNVENGPKKKRR